jgi:hypothetical protein
VYMAKGQLDKFTDSVGKATVDVGKAVEKMFPGATREENRRKPYYATGARCLIKIGGQPATVVQDFKWSVAYNATPTQTIDTLFPWDIELGQVAINGTLNKTFDPLRGPEADRLFSIMTAAIHQPMVEMQVIYRAPYAKQNRNGDSTGEIVPFSMFFARGMFTAVNGNVAVGQLSGLTAQFVGVAYQHYVSQTFTPYGVTYMAQEALETAKGYISKFTGGFL